MKLSTLIAISAVASILTQSSAFAQEAPTPETPASIAPAEKSSEKSSEKSAETPATAPVSEKPAETPVAQKKYSIGPVIEFGGSGASFGITGKYKYPLIDNFSVRPIVLFGYKPVVTGSNVNNAFSVVGGNGVFTQTELDTIAGSVGSGFAYGASITYDLKSADNKIVGYVGPRLLLAKASGNGSIVRGSNTATFKIDTQEVTVGLTAGADFAITSDLTAGLNATYNLYRSLSIGELGTQNAGTSSSFGINVTYNF
jgi:opacity protein-like surface antigen